MTYISEALEDIRREKQAKDLDAEFSRKKQEIAATMDRPAGRLIQAGEGKRRPGDPRFHALLQQIGDLHDKKQADYGRTGDPFANVRASEDFGIDGWIGCLVRANDKMRRLQTAAKGNTLANESVEDSLMDLAVYALIALVLYREEEA